ncbi:MAG: divalent metal cation transporter [Bacteroidales bacterium]|nr:divalent metal cation transporter [Bacteroidales bacterium]
MKFRHRILNILFWSIVSAAFIGPGTVTTAARSGSLFGTSLMWVLLFSTLACLLLQEAASRITILSGKNIGEIISLRTRESRFAMVLPGLIVLAICGGAAAYEMGNLIGAREGIMLVFPKLDKLIVPALGGFAVAILLVPSLKFISRFMGILVMILGILFLYTAIRIAPPVNEVLKGLFIPSMPSGSEAPWLALALIGTTIVPYNLFLGSGISKGVSRISEMRWGLSVAILLGGIFSLSVIVVGDSVKGAFSFQGLAEALSQKSMVNGNLILGIGLFAAGFTSAITAPLASAITLKSLFGNSNSKKWDYNGWYFRLSWMVVLGIGMAFGMTNVKPVPAIILAQALNGLVLPIVSFILVYFVHDTRLMGKQNHPLNSVALGLTLIMTVVIGLNNLVLSISGSLGITIEKPGLAFVVYATISAMITGLFYLYIFRRRNFRSIN